MDKEKKFILKNQPKWIQLENLLNNKKKNFQEINDLGDLYLQVTEDLSYAQTHFPGSEVSDYINHLVRSCHMVFHKQKNPTLKRIYHFLINTVPAMIYSLRRPILLSIAVFYLAMVISFFMVYHNHQYGEMFLSAGMYEKAMQDIEFRKKFSNFDSIPAAYRGIISYQIWLNNSIVSLLCFVYGITLGLGTIYILIRNGFMLGGLLAVYYINGHFLDFISIIMVHGSIELVAIYIAGGAGLSLGQALLLPGRNKRREKLKQTALKALTCFFGVVVMLVMAAVIEGQVTTLKLAVPLRIAIAVINTVLLLLYFSRGYLLMQADKNLQPAV